MGSRRAEGSDGDGDDHPIQDHNKNDDNGTISSIFLNISYMTNKLLLIYFYALFFFFFFWEESPELTGIGKSKDSQTHTQEKKDLWSLSRCPTSKNLKCFSFLLVGILDGIIAGLAVKIYCISPSWFFFIYLSLVVVTEGEVVIWIFIIYNFYASIPLSPKLCPFQIGK